MLQSRTTTSPTKLSMIAAAFAAAAFLGANESALAADHAISPQTSTFNCSNARPGDTITLASGTRGPLTISNCNASTSNPITIRNDAGGTGPTIIRRASGSGGGFVFSCNNCVGVVIDGSNKWRGAPNEKSYGIKVTMTGGGSPSSFLRIGGRSRFVTIRNVEVDGAWPAIASNGIGISVNDHSVKRSSNPGMWREGIVIEHSYVHNTGGEGMYVGPNYREGDLPLRNIEIAYNLVEDIGWEGINTKSMWAGENSIHHNVLRRVGKSRSNSRDRTQYSGINNNAGTVKIYNNWIEKTGQHGIQWWNPEGPFPSEGIGPFETHIWNNVIVDAGALWLSFMGGSHGINIGAKLGTEKAIAYIYNNTIVNPRENAVHLTSDVAGGYVRDNIIAGASGSAISAPSLIKQINNAVGGVSQMAFVDPAASNFRLRADSPARNRGGSGHPDRDFDDVVRPQDGAPDQGAFEYTTNAAASASPQAPSALTVE